MEEIACAIAAGESCGRWSRAKNSMVVTLAKKKGAIGSHRQSPLWEEGSSVSWGTRGQRYFGLLLEHAKREYSRPFPPPLPPRSFAGDRKHSPSIRGKTLVTKVLHSSGMLQTLRYFASPCLAIGESLSWEVQTPCLYPS